MELAEIKSFKYLFTLPYNQSVRTILGSGNTEINNISYHLKEATEQTIKTQFDESHGRERMVCYGSR